MEKNDKKNLEKPAPLSLSHYLSSAGIASRRQCAELVKSGKVSVAGQIVTAPGFKITGSPQVCCNGKSVNSDTLLTYIMLHKPPGYTCSSSDRHADKLALDLVKIPNVRLFSAGRLDCGSEGLLILTNDGDYADRLTHPRYQICKTYLVTTNAAINDHDLKKIRAGITDNGEILKPEGFDQLGECRYRIVLNEGKKREIRRLLAAVGKDTVVLQRVAVGKLQLGKLASGTWRHLSPAEVQQSLIPGLHQL